MTPLAQFVLKSAQRTFVAGMAAGVLSGLMLGVRSRADTGRFTPAINAPSHWQWGREAIRRTDVTVSRALVGAILHQGAAVFWGALYEYLQSRRARRTAANAALDAALVTSTAAIVDLKVMPPRLTPGLEDRLSNRSLVLVYGLFAVGLALGGSLANRRY